MSKNANTINIYSDNDVISDTGESLYISTGATGAIGAADSNAYSWNANSSIDWNNITIGSSNIAGTNGTMIRPSGRLELQGEDADIKINGRSLMDAIDALEQRLNILVPNPELEAEWDELRELGERYRALEKQCTEKGNMWKKLKSMPPPTKP
jgi:hypothetical protein